MKKILQTAAMAAFCILNFASCGKKIPEMTLEEIAEYSKNYESLFSKKTKYKPYESQKFVDGKTGGTWNDSITSDPKTFNQYIAHMDGASHTIISQTLDALLDYDAYKKKWTGRTVDYEIETNEKKGTLTVHYTLKENLYWTWYGKKEKVPVTSDDIVFWYNEIEPNPDLKNSGYNGQFLTMPDGSEAHIDCVKIDERRFDFVFPRIVADPLLSTNTEFFPSFMYKKALKEKGAEGVKSLFNISSDPKELPSMGEWYIVEYTPGQRIVCKRNPYYHEKDSSGNASIYPDTKIIRIVGNQSTDYLLFKQGKLECYTPQPEEVNDVIENQKDQYTVYRADGSLGATMWTFNQNPKNKDEKFYKWFCKKEFRQAMSCLLNRDRIIFQTYRGLAEVKDSFFPEPNEFYNPQIKLEYMYNKEKAKRLLEKIGIKQDKKGVMRDSSGDEISFDLSISSASGVLNDIAQIVADECASVGITVNIRQIDFQKMVEQLTATFDWQSIFVGLGTNYFPSQGSNVWPSSGNMHLWNPSQASPATEWEARVDYLYNEASYTINRETAKKYWNEYQRIILEQCPIIYLVRSKSFCAFSNRWNSENFYYDNKNGAMTSKVFLSAQ